MRSRHGDRECKSVDSAGIRGDAGIDVVVVLVEVERGVVVVVECDGDPWCYHVLTLKEERKREHQTHNEKEKALCVQW